MPGKITIQEKAGKTDIVLSDVSREEAQDTLQTIVDILSKHIAGFEDISKADIKTGISPKNEIVLRCNKMLSQQRIDEVLKRMIGLGWKFMQQPENDLKIRPESVNQPSVNVLYTAPTNKEQRLNIQRALGPVFHERVSVNLTAEGLNISIIPKGKENDIELQKTIYQAIDLATKSDNKSPIFPHRI
jgi:hypothetical protein